MVIVLDVACEMNTQISGRSKIGVVSLPSGAICSETEIIHCVLYPIRTSVAGIPKRPKGIWIS